jgi:GxxExxY protein
MEVYRTLGPGFVESIYRNALCRELTCKGIAIEPEQEVSIAYKDHVVGRHRLDLLVDRRVIVELKAVSGILDVHLAQALSYLKATHVEVALIVNFGATTLRWKRLVKSRN